MEKENNKKDTSMETAYVVMTFCAVVGLLTAGLGGAVVGAMFGFAITAIVFICQEAVKK